MLSVMVMLLGWMAFTSCNDRDYRIKGEGPVVQNTRTPGTFNGVSLSMSADVEVYRSSDFRVELHGQQNILNVIETRVSNGTLHISVEYRYRITRYSPLRIRVYMPDVRALDISGSGDITCTDNFSPARLHAGISGSGNITFSGNVSDVFQANISGSGNITYAGSGTCRVADYTISGSGNIHAEWLQAEDADANISGSGDIRLYAVKTLHATISGSGDILYRGSPEVYKSISGSGKVIQLP